MFIGYFEDRKCCLKLGYYYYFKSEILLKIFLVGIFKCVCNSCVVQGQACVARTNSRGGQKHTRVCTLAASRNLVRYLVFSDCVFQEDEACQSESVSVCQNMSWGSNWNTGSFQADLMELSHYRFYSTPSLNSFLCIVSSFLHKTEIRQSLDIRISRKSNQIQITPKKARAIKMTKQNERGKEPLLEGPGSWINFAIRSLGQIQLNLKGCQTERTRKNFWDSGSERNIIKFQSFYLLFSSLPSSPLLSSPPLPPPLSSSFTSSSPPAFLLLPPSLPPFFLLFS